MALKQKKKQNKTKLDGVQFAFCPKQGKLRVLS